MTDFSYWAATAEATLTQLKTDRSGLSQHEATERLSRYGHNSLKPKKHNQWVKLLLHQFSGSIIVILIVAAGLSLFFNDRIDTLIIASIILLSAFLGFWQEYSASQAVESLLALVQSKTVVVRHGQTIEIPSVEVVPGDILILSAGETIPADCRLIEVADFYVDEASLTGESFPVLKQIKPVAENASLSKRTNSTSMGTHVTSGSAVAVVTTTGQATAVGKIASTLKTSPAETDFEHGVRRFGYLLAQVTVSLIALIFIINLYFGRPLLESLLFALALAVGLTPQLLPAIISINLAHGAKAMANHKVIVKRLASIENFGSMNVLCSDKTGTLTEGKVQLFQSALADGQQSLDIIRYAFVAATFDAGFTNPINEAIRQHHPHDLAHYSKVTEVPYDSIRKRISILIKEREQLLLLMKGTFPTVLQSCTHYQDAQGKVHRLGQQQVKLQATYQKLSEQGYRVQAMAYKKMNKVAKLTQKDEGEMIFIGWLAFSDPLKAGITQTIRKLAQLGIQLKMISGDSIGVAKLIGEQVGLHSDQIMTGQELHELSEEALLQRVNEVSIFAEIEPHQKEQIVMALKRAGNIVGYMGDGVNDTPALHAADVSISVEDAVDVAKETADIVLLRKDLAVLLAGVEQGRRTFANTLKYVYMATSANFGNMFSVAGASLFLPFLPLLPKQILLTNLLTDFPETAIATDSVDLDALQKPRRWNITEIRNFMIVFGLISSIFDALTFIILMKYLHATPELFRTGWFVESVVSASLIVLVIRTHKPFYRSRPGKYLWRGTLLVGLLTVLIPFSPLAKPFGFVPLPAYYIVVLTGVMLCYVATAEAAKHLFYRNSR